MKKQILLSAAAIIAVTSLFFLGKTSEKKTVSPVTPAAETAVFDISRYIESGKISLSGEKHKMADSLSGLLKLAEGSQKALILNELADFWRDSANNMLIFSYYVSEAAKLENSVKNLNFAAQYSTSLLRSEAEQSRADWLADNALDLYDRALKLEPDNDDLKIGQGSVYIFRQNKNGSPESTMKGIMQILEVARKDSNNMKAQLMLGIGGFVSGQYDKAEKRLLKVTEKDPGNLEAAAFLADTYAAQGKKEEAIKWYEVSKRLANDPGYSEEADERIRMLRNKR